MSDTDVIKALELLENIDGLLNNIGAMLYIIIVVAGVYVFWKGIYKLLMRFA